MGFVGDDDAVSFFDRREDGRQIEGHQGAGIDNFHFDTFLGELFRRLESHLHGVRGRDQRHIVSLPLYVGDAEGNRLVVVGQRAANVQKLDVIDEDGRIVSGHRGFEQAFHVAR
jgi:hypothetical protein